MVDPFVVSQPVRDAGALAGRFLMGAIFVWFGYFKSTAAAGTIAYFSKLGLPAPSIAYAVTVAVELIVGLLFVIGLFGRTAALVLAVWCIATAFAGHSDFADRNMLIHFYKNVAMCGGFLYAALMGPGGFSVDALISRRRGNPYARSAPIA
jgi:putative oxidoreductase